MDISATIYKSGKVTIPAKFREKYNVKVGDKVTFSDEGGELKILTKDQQLEAAQAIFRQYFNPDESAVDALIADRRKEARRELEEMEPLDKKDVTQ